MHGKHQSWLAVALLSGGTGAILVLLLLLLPSDPVRSLSLPPYWLHLCIGIGIIVTLFMLTRNPAWRYLRAYSTLISFLVFANTLPAFDLAVKSEGWIGRWTQEGVPWHLNMVLGLLAAVLAVLDYLTHRPLVPDRVITSLLRELDAEQLLRGKHEGEEFVIRVHKHLRFPTSKDDPPSDCNKPRQRRCQTDTINPPPTDAKTNTYLVKRWHTWVAALAALVTIGTLLFVGALQGWEPMQTLSGVIQDKNREGLSGVVVKLPEFQLTTRTDSSGKFTFHVKASKQQSVRLEAFKEGYKPFATSNATLGNADFSFHMERQP